MKALPDLLAGLVFAAAGVQLMAASFGWAEGKDNLVYAGVGALLLVRALEFVMGVVGIEVVED